jgi:hypothetical protein
MRKKDKVENEKEVGYKPRFDLVDIECEDPPLFLRPRPVRKPRPKKHCKKDLPLVREVTIN